MPDAYTFLAPDERIAANIRLLFGTRPEVAFRGRTIPNDYRHRVFAGLWLTIHGRDQASPFSVPRLTAREAARRLRELGWYPKKDKPC